LRALRNGDNVASVLKRGSDTSIATTQRYLDHLQSGELRCAVPHLPV
jgi:hypothetical protein